MQIAARRDASPYLTLFRPVIEVIGRLTFVLGLAMLLPAALDWMDEHDAWLGTAVAAFLTATAGIALTLAGGSGGLRGLNRRQAFLLTVMVWLVLPIFGSLPFMLGPPFATFTDAFFEAMSGLTTTGATVFTELDTAPRGMLLWRAMLQWFGGVGIVIFAMVFLPMLKIGGMQFFQSEGFDLGGGTTPRATEMARELGWIYLALTVACVLAYAATGFTTFDALCHAMTTVSTGGLGNSDSGFFEVSRAGHWVAILFMSLAALPFIRLIQFSRGNTTSIWRDRQVRAYVLIVLSVSFLIWAWLVFHGHHSAVDAVTESVFNVVSVMTGTGYSSDNYSEWGGFALAIFFALGLVGGCTGSTSCSAKIFRYQILLAALRIQLKRIHSPHGVYPLRYAGRSVDAEVLSSVMGFFFFFALCLVLWSILFSLTGEDLLTSISASVAALANLGPGLGEKIGPAGNYKEFSELGKWIFSGGMLLGRLEFLSVLVLLTPAFWAR